MTLPLIWPLVVTTTGAIYLDSPLCNLPEQKMQQLSMLHCTHLVRSHCFSVPFTFHGDSLVITVVSDTKSDKSFGTTEYKVTIVAAPGGRINGKGRKDKLGVDFAFQCSCISYKKHNMCKHIACICTVHFN